MARVDPVAELVGFEVGEGPFHVAQHDSDEDVLLSGGHANPFDR